MSFKNIKKLRPQRSSSPSSNQRIHSDDSASSMLQWSAMNASLMSYADDSSSSCCHNSHSGDYSSCDSSSCDSGSCCD